MAPGAVRPGTVRRFGTAVAVVAVVAVLWLLAGCGDDSAAPSTTSPDLTGTTEPYQQEPPNPVSVTAEGFEPEELRVAVGESVTWTNDDPEEPHWVAGDERNTMDSATLMPGNSYTYVFDEPGTYTYFNPFHEQNRGTIRVG